MKVCEGIDIDETIICLFFDTLMLINNYFNNTLIIINSLPSQKLLIGVIYVVLKKRLRT